MKHVMSRPSSRKEVNYEEWYHRQRHNTHFNDEYYSARAKIALTKFFSGIDKHSRVLDYGCGLGQNIYYLPNAFGYDISNFGVDFCKRKGLNATTHLDELPDESFDVILAAHVLEHHPNPKQMVESMASKLKKGKTLILVIPCEPHGKGQFTLDLNQHLYAWNFQTINNLLVTSGFEILENRFLYGAGYNKLLPLVRKSFWLYKWTTNMVSRLLGIKELMVKARKL